MGDKVEWDCGNALRWTEWSLDIALKSSVPHPKYKQKMHGLLKEYMHLETLRDIICEYTQNGYWWYRLEYQEHKLAEWHDCSPAEEFHHIMYNIVYDDDDYFRDNTFYKPFTEKAKTGPAVKFSVLRSELDSEFVDSMKDEDLAQFLLDIDKTALSAQWQKYEMLDSIVKYHAKK